MVLEVLRFVDLLVFPSTSVTQSQNLDRPTIDDVEKRGEEESKRRRSMCLSLLDRCSQQDARTSAHGWSRQKAPARQLNLCFVRSLLWLFVSSSFSGFLAPKHSSSSQWPSDSLLKDTTPYLRQAEFRFVSLPPGLFLTTPPPLPNPRPKTDNAVFGMRAICPLECYLVRQRRRFKTRAKQKFLLHVMMDLLQRCVRLRRLSSPF